MVCPDQHFLDAVGGAGGDALLRAARLLSGDWAQAEDLLQRSLSTFLSVRDAGQDHDATWVGLRQELLSTYLAGPAEPPPCAHATGRGGTGNGLLARLAELDPVLRAAVVGRCYLTLTDRQAARALGMTPRRAGELAAHCLDWLGSRHLTDAADSSPPDANAGSASSAAKSATSSAAKSATSSAARSATQPDLGVATTQPAVSGRA